MLKQFIEKKEKEFDEIIESARGLFLSETKDRIKSFHSQSLQDFATLLRSEIEGRRKSENDCIDRFFEMNNVGYNTALTDILALLEK